MSCLQCEDYRPSDYAPMGYCRKPKGQSIQAIELRARLFHPRDECWVLDKLSEIPEQERSALE